MTVIVVLAWLLLLPPAALLIAIAGGRLLGARRGWFALAVSATLGTTLGILAAGALTSWDWASLDMVLVTIVFALVFTMLLALTLDFVAPEGSLSRGEASGRITVANPIAGARRRARPLMRYREVLQIARRNGVLARDLGLHDRPVEVRETLEDAGGIFVKLGQVASTRTDVLPQTWCDELARLRSKATPVPAETMRPFIEDQLGGDVDRWFDRFDWEPIAAASIAQVYRAHHRERGEMVVKVQRPGLDETFVRDAEAIRQLAALIERRTMLGLELHPAALAEEFLNEVAEELDFTIEANNAAELALGLQPIERVRVPRIDREIVGTRLLVEEYIDAPTIGEISRGTRSIDGLDRDDLASRLVEAFLYQLFDLGTFHADPHPGNILIEDDGTIVLIDLGAIGRIGPEQRAAFLDMLVTAAAGQSTGFRQALERLTVLDRRVDVRELDAALDGFLARNMRAGGGITASTLEELTVLIGTFGIHLPRWFGVLMRTMVTLEGTLVELQPDFSLVDAARQRAEHRGLHPSASGWREALENEMLVQLPRLRRVPQRVDELLGQAVTGGLSVQVSAFSDERDERVVTRLVDRIVLAIIAAATGIGAVLLLGVDGGPELGGSIPVNEVIGYVGLAGASVLAMRVIAGVIRDGET